MNTTNLWLLTGLRTPFCRVDGDLAGYDAIEMSLPVARAMSQQVQDRIDVLIWGEVVPTLAYSNIAREIWLDAQIDARVPALSTRMACSTSMAAVFDAVGYLGQEDAVALCGGVESMTNVQVGLKKGFSNWLRRLTEISGPGEALRTIARVPVTSLGLHIPSVTNRSTGMSMGEHCEVMAKDWDVSREVQDRLALDSHENAVSGQEQRFFEDLIVDVNGVSTDAFPRTDTSLEALSGLFPSFDRESGTITAGNASPLTDGAAGVWLARERGLDRFEDAHPRVKLLDWEVAAVDIFNEGLLMAPAYAIPRLLERHDLVYDDIDLWEIHEAFAAQVECHFRALESEAFLRERVGVDTDFGEVPKDRVNPHGGSVALGHPFAATGARILSQAVKELATREAGTRAIVSICANGGLGTVTLLEAA